MPYPDLPAPPTFWRCPACGAERLFRASGVGSVACGACGKFWTVDQLVAAHHAAHPEASPAPASD